MCNGASDRARTGDPRFTRAVLYQLSYAGGHVVTQLRRQRLSMIRDIANPRKGSDGFSHFKCTNIRGVMSAVPIWCLSCCRVGGRRPARMGLKQNGAAMAQPNILLTRIDDRFIYGQDVALWNEAVGSNLVLIVNDEIAADSRQWAPMRVAAPRRRLDTVFLGAKDRRHHSYRNAAPVDSDHGGLTCRCARAG